MGLKINKTNWRVEVTPEFYYSQTAASRERDCNEIAAQIVRHVDGVKSSGVFVLHDDERVCEHCGSKWTEDSTDYNGGCCSKDVEPADAA